MQYFLVIHLAEVLKVLFKFINVDLKQEIIFAKNKTNFVSRDFISLARLIFYEDRQM
jgi:hypothetical protein